MRHIIAMIAALAVLGSATASAQTPWLHIYYPKGEKFQQFPMSEIDEICFDEATSTMTVECFESDKDNGWLNVELGAVDHFEIGANVPAIRIETDDPKLKDVTSKTEYIPATLAFEGMGIYDDLTSEISIRGRGNSTWGMPKKPYNVKFKKKTSMGIFEKMKTYVLLANYVDPSMMRNMAAYTLDQLIGMPYPHHVMPVNVWFNGDYKGSYMLTEKTGFNGGSVELSDEDEARSIMFEFDTNSADEDEYPFNSAYFDDEEKAFLPVRVKDPDAPEDEEERKAWLGKWQDDLNSFMRIVAEGDTEKIFEACDLETLVKYIMVFDICGNMELFYPKSAFVYKTEGGKYMFGPCWDFDWCFGQDIGVEDFILRYSHDGYYGGLFFQKLCKNEKFLKRFDEVWQDFLTNKQEAFWQEFNRYAKALKPSAHLQSSVSENYRDHETRVAELREWISKRIDHISKDPNRGLW